MSKLNLAATLEPDPSRVVVAFPVRNDAPPHERASQQALARKLALLLKLEFIEHYDPSQAELPYAIYYVPSRTLVRSDADTDPSRRFIHDIHDINDHDDLFGGIVPYTFVATKAITHSLLHGDSVAPLGWSHEFGRAVESVVLQGTTVFSMSEARIAALRLLAIGPIRLKPVRASGGRGQILVQHADDFEAALSNFNEEVIQQHGLVIEEHLENVETLSVGQVHINGLTISYVGSQILTPDNDFQEVYGGSSLRCVPGDYERLLALGLNPDEQAAIRMARQYDLAADRCYGIYASRRNYDILIGTDAHGRRKTGVLEQSWRAGGASYAEACAVEAFLASPDLVYVQTCTRECYGPQPYVPRNAEIIYKGVDPEIGLVTKYGAIESYGHTK